ncbi:MAG: carbamate kinase [Planctomycetota bacterium]
MVQITYKKNLIVVALGGNAISRPNQEGNVPQQFENTSYTMQYVAGLVEAGYQPLVTHGNGPQVGNVLRRVELAARELYRLPLHICGAHTQGGMGFMLAQCLNNALLRRSMQRKCTAIVTSVEVDRADPAFQWPTKPIGGFYNKERAEELQREHGWQMIRVPNRGYRRVVPSPAPRAIVEIDLIRRLADAGDLLVAAGGGGIPVARDAQGQYVGVEAVIDKDRTAALLGRTLDAPAFLIVTDVRRVALNYGTEREQPLERLSVSEAKRYHADGQFPPGSMGPKIEAAIEFLRDCRKGDARVIICDIEHMGDALAGRSGTTIEPDE